MTKQQKILVVDDDPSLRNLIVAKIQSSGYTVFSAADGETALKIALKEHPDLILLDIMLPKMDGIAVLKELREDEWGEDALVVMLTSLEDPEKIAKAAEYGSYAYIVKMDLSLNQIVEIIKEKLSER